MPVNYLHTLYPHRSSMINCRRLRANRGSCKNFQVNNPNASPRLVPDKLLYYYGLLVDSRGMSLVTI